MRTSYLLAIVGLVIAGYFLAKIIRETDIAGSLQYIASIAPFSLAALFLISIVGVFADTLGWHLLLPRENTRKNLWKMLRVRIVSEAVVSTVPAGSIIADPLKAWLLKRAFGLTLACGSASVALRTFLLADAQSLLTIIVTLLSLPWLFQVSPDILSGAHYLAWLMLGASLAACCIYTILLYLGSHRASLDKLHRGLRKIRIGFLSTWIAKNERSFTDLRNELAEFGGSQAYRLWISGGLYIVLWMTDAVETYVLLRLLGIDIALGTAIEIEILCGFLRSIAFFVPSGIGLQDAAYLGFLKSIGASNPGAAAFILLKRMRQLVWIVLGYGLLLTIRKVKWNLVAPGIADEQAHH